MKDDPCIYIDPGVDYFAWVLFDDDRLKLAGYSRRIDIDEIARYARRAVIEKPYVQQSGGRSAHQRSSNKTIQELCIAAGEYGGHFPQRHYVYPGAAPKHIRHERALAALTREEVELLPRYKTHMEHVGCALYIGMKDVGRLS